MANQRLKDDLNGMQSKLATDQIRIRDAFRQRTKERSRLMKLHTKKKAGDTQTMPLATACMCMCMCPTTYTAIRRNRVYARIPGVT